MTRSVLVWSLVLAAGVALCGGAAAAAEAPSVERGRELFRSGRLVEAEAELKAAAAAIDAGKLPRNELNRCLEPLAEIYRAWGRYGDALAIAERQTKLLAALARDNPRTVGQALHDNAVLRGDLLVALARESEAEQVWRGALAAAEPGAQANPVPPLALQVRLARLAESREDAAAARQWWQQAARQARGAIDRIEQKQLADRHYAACAAALAAAYVAAQDFPRAVDVKEKLLAHQRRKQDRAAEVTTRLELATLWSEMRDYQRAERELREALAQQSALGGHGAREAEIVARLGAALKSQGQTRAAAEQFDRAASLYRPALAQAEQRRGGEQQVLEILQRWGAVEQQAGRLRQAVELARRLAELRQTRLGKDHPLSVAARADLGALYGAMQEFDQARPLLAEALQYWRRRQPPAPLQVARALNDLGVVERSTGSLPQARALFEEALDLRRKLLPADDLRVAYSLANLASVFLDQGHYARAVVLLDQAAGIYRARGTAARDALSNTLLNLAMVYKSQGRLTDAQRYCQEALQVFQAAFGREAAGGVSHLNALASLAIARGKLADATAHNQQALALIARHQMEDEPVAATAWHQQALIEYQRADYQQAIETWQRALAVFQATGQAAAVTRTLNYLARSHEMLGQAPAAARFYRQAVARQQTVQAFPTVSYLSLCGLAQLEHEQGRTDEAIALVQRAVQLVETPRAAAVGAEEERAEYFAQFASAFDQLVSWNLEAGRVAEAFAYAERGRNRTFLDQLRLAGVDLRETLQGEAGQKLLLRERELRTQVGTLRARGVAAAEASGSEGTLRQLAAELEQAQKEYAEVWSEIRNASPVYRERLAQGTELGTLDQARQAMVASRSLMLFYYLGSKQSYLLLIGGSEAQPRVVPLEVPSSLSAALGVPAGPLTRTATVKLVSEYLADLRDRAGGRGLAGIVRSEKGVQAGEQGTVLAEVLLPRAVRQVIQSAAPRSVVIVPDGALHQLPFEALLVEQSPQRKYLLDVLPPVAYAPSATILLNLQQRGGSVPSGSPSLLTVANPAYLAPEKAPPTLTLASAARDAYLGLGGRLPLLPGTSRECARVAQAFPAERVTRFESREATEANVRRAIAGRRFVHLAAHGLVDQQHDNLFGAIALTPPAAGDSAENDGFLSLHEIHALPLAECELAVLSACQTNVGDDRPLEAGATLAQAFLAGGARRVVCSHWNVDDASTAEMMGQFFQLVAQAAQGKEPVEYARALHEAQLRIRAQEKWSAPYYWAPFVLLGPAE